MTNEPSQINEDIEILLNNIKTIIDDTDNEEVKKKVNDYIKTVSNNYNITVIGQINSGKSSFINSLIGKDICDVSVVPSTKAVREINCGNTHEALKGLCIYDTPGIGIINSDVSSLSAEYIAKCEMVIFIIPADDPDSSSVWDVLAENKYSPYRRFLFVLQKSDTEDENTLRKIKYDIKTKADKLQISDYTICEVSSLEEELSGDGGFEEIRNSLRSLVCENKNNDKINTIMTELASIISSVQRSLALRKQQYEENLRIAEAVDEIIARFRKNNPAYSFVEDIRESIDNEFETFRKIIVRKLEPSRIKEDFATKDDFRIW
ncbi:MAG: dynamin family protein, partial [Firmicutes bacterium]|nr:dynamin family protein [Bacillota bacterium]